MIPGLPFFLFLLSSPPTRFGRGILGDIGFSSASPSTVPSDVSSLSGRSTPFMFIHTPQVLSLKYHAHARARYLEHDRARSLTLSARQYCSDKRSSYNAHRSSLPRHRYHILDTQECTRVFPRRG
ncbi:hypothetical protein C2E23DRAFT_231303 [Lenzites betulinus]|nr:hypothetical protein C2E23DRAFT_231303 [Lenzites betulinus]